MATSLIDAVSQPAGPCLEALSLRAYAAAFQAFNDPQQGKTDLPDTPMMRLVKLNHFRRQFGREPVIASG